MQAKDLSLTNAKREFIYECSQSANRVGAVMMIVSVIAGIGALVALINYGWWPAMALFILGTLAFGMSRLSDLIGDLFGLIEGREKSD